MENRLTILWTNADPLTAEHMVFMYARASVERGWWDQVEIIIWGATAKLVAENKEIQKKLLDVQEAGVYVGACIACARNLGVVEEIMDLGFEVKGMGPVLTDRLKGDGKVLTV